MATTYPSTHPTGYPQAKHRPNFVESLFSGLTEEKTSDNRGIKVKWLMNFFKATTAIFILSLMNHYRNHSLGSHLYLGLHGVYGLIWLLKDMAFPDRNFERRVGIFGAITHIMVLSAYWLLPWIQISGHGIDKPSSERVMTCIMLFAMGVATMIAADAQKTFTLRQQEVLITDGMFKYSRNPNYLGEMMVHASFALVTGSVIAWGVIFIIWGTFFFPRMIAKDASLRNKGGSEEYFARSSMLLPKLFFQNTLLHYLSWIVIFGAIFTIGGMVSFTHVVKRMNPISWFFHKLR